MKKLAAMIITAAMALHSFGCWYNRINYNDYIHSVNGTVRIGPVDNTVTGTKKMFYVTNNIVVDFPVTVDIKLVSESAVTVSEDKKPQLLKCILQYRVLPDGKWVTVEEKSIPTGTIPFSAPPGPYLNRNNVWPKKCKAGDVVMIRLYVTDGTQFQSGDISDLCDEQVEVGKSEKFPEKATIPDHFEYTPNEGSSMIEVDLGGMWAPHYVVTVIYSGRTRPIQ